MNTLCQVEPTDIATVASGMTRQNPQAKCSGTVDVATTQIELSVHSQPLRMADYYNSITVGMLDEANKVVVVVGNWPSPLEEEANKPSWIEETLCRLSDVAELPANWDGEGSCETDPTLVKAAADLLMRLDRSWERRLPVPDIFPIRGGSFQFEWESTKAYLEIEILDPWRAVFVREHKTLGGGTMDSGELLLTETQEFRALVDWFASTGG